MTILRTAVEGEETRWVCVCAWEVLFLPAGFPFDRVIRPLPPGWVLVKPEPA